MTAAGIRLHQRVEAKPGQKLVDLIAANRLHQEAGGELEEAA